MASLGYLAVAPGHRESGREVVRERVKARGLREGLAELITSPQAYQARFMDIASVTHWARPQRESRASDALTGLNHSDVVNGLTDDVGRSWKARPSCIAPRHGHRAIGRSQGNPLGQLGW